MTPSRPGAPRNTRWWRSDAPAKKADALAGLERWKTRHADVTAHLRASDVLVDAMRGRFHTWTRIRVNLERVPPELRPAQEPLDPNDDLDDWSNVAAGPAAGSRGRQEDQLVKLCSPMERTFVPCHRFT